jgi:hypothetical protein
VAYNAKTKQMERAPSAKPGDKTFGPNGSFKGGDIKHDRLAIAMAPRSRNVGHISAATAASIQSKARADLNRLEGGGKTMAEGKPDKRKRSDAPHPDRNLGKYLHAAKKMDAATNEDAFNKAFGVK